MLVLKKSTFLPFIIASLYLAKVFLFLNIFYN